jgi:DNA-binding transcriptional LysR family regulator
VNLRSLDLNLLVVLDALLEERHVTRAATRIGLSQPAMSNALSRLRAMFGDTLLLRTPHGMEPTPRAIALAGPVRRALRQVQRLLDAEEAFDPATCRQGFTLRMSDLLGRLLLPALMTRLRAEAPGVSLDIVHLPPTQTVDRLEADQCDLAVSMGLVHGNTIQMEPAMADRMVCVMRADHPLAHHELTLEAFLELGHLKVSISPTDSRFVDDVLARDGLQRRVVLNLPHWLVVPEVVRGSDLAAVMPERLARVFEAEGGLALRALPFASAGFQWAIYWHRRHEGSRALGWLRGMLRRTMAEA